MTTQTCANSGLPTATSKLDNAVVVTTERSELPMGLARAFSK